MNTTFFKCARKKCEKQYQTLASLKRHQKEAHGQLYSPIKVCSGLACTNCGKECASARSLAQHSRWCSNRPVKKAVKQSTKLNSRYWTNVEHYYFLSAIQKFGTHDYNAIADTVGTKDRKQVDSHMVKYRLSLKNNKPMKVIDLSKDSKFAPYDHLRTLEYLNLNTEEEEQEESTDDSDVCFGPDDLEEPTSFKSVPKIRKNIKPLSIPSENWNIAASMFTNLKEVEAVFSFPIAKCTDAEWLHFEKSLYHLESEIHSLFTKLSAPAKPTTTNFFLEASANAKICRKTVKILAKISAYRALNKDFSYWTSKLPQEIRSLLPDFTSADWPDKWSNVRKIAARALSKALRKKRISVKIDEDINLQKLFNLNRPKAINRVLGTSKPTQCTMNADAVESYYSSIYKKPPDINNNPKWARDITWPTQCSFLDNFGHPVTLEEIDHQIKRMKNCSTPGIDGLPYEVWKKLPCTLLLKHIFEICRINARIPSRWNISKTILLFKKGDTNDITNWRPISLQITLYKLFAATIAKRLMVHSYKFGTITNNQKGFLKASGCHEHTFVLKSILEDVKRKHKSINLVWYDLKNAFGTVPHQVIAWAAHKLNVPTYITELVHNIYAASYSFIALKDYNTRLIPMHCGIKQGCPLSPLLFNLCMDPLLRLLNATPGYTFANGSTISALAYADDLVHIAEFSYDAIKQKIIVEKWIFWARLSISISDLNTNQIASKCAFLSLSYASGSIQSIDLDITVENVKIPVMDKSNLYHYLGTDIGIHKSSIKFHDKVLQDAKLIADSGLKIWQKILALKVWCMTKFPFHLANTFSGIKECEKFDIGFRTIIKRMLSLPTCTNSDFFYTPATHGGLGFLPLKEEHSCQLVVVLYYYSSCL